MGQQQMLILVLVAVIVGIAIIAGLKIYSRHEVRMNWDRLIEEVMEISTDAQEWKQRPEIFGGSLDANKEDEDNFEGVQFLDLIYARDDIYGSNFECYNSMNGVYMLEGTTDGLTIEAFNELTQNYAKVTVDGTLESSIMLASPSDLIRGGLKLDGSGNGSVTNPACS